MKKVEAMFYILLFFLIVVLDRVTKFFALSLLQEYTVNNYLSLWLTFNPGINFGLLRTNNYFGLLLLNTIIGSVLLIFFFFVLYKSERDPLSLIPNILILAGGISNYFDRFYYNGVIDFIVFSAKGWSWPAFNIADVAIVTGIFFMLLFYKNKNYYRNAAPTI